MSDHVEYKPATAQDLAKLDGLGRFLEENRTPEKARTWKILFFAALAVMVVLNLVIPNHHPHFGLDKIPGFWPVFGLAVGAVMVFFVKKIVQPIIKRPEDFYEDV